jgi:hypothetical protein
VNSTKAVESLTLPHLARVSVTLWTDVDQFNSISANAGIFHNKASEAPFLKYLAFRDEEELYRIQTTILLWEFICGEFDCFR